MENPRFNVGDEVVALTNPSNNNCQPRVKGNIYTVKVVMYCSVCGKQLINVSGKSEGDVTSCACGNEINDGGYWISESGLFALVQDMTAQIEEALEEPIYAHRH